MKSSTSNRSFEFPSFIPMLKSPTIEERIYYVKGPIMDLENPSSSLRSSHMKLIRHEIALMFRMIFDGSFWFTICNREFSKRVPWLSYMSGENSTSSNPMHVRAEYTILAFWEFKNGRISFSSQSSSLENDFLVPSTKSPMVNRETCYAYQLVDFRPSKQRGIIF